MTQFPLIHPDINLIMTIIIIDHYVIHAAGAYRHIFAIILSL